MNKSQFAENMAIKSNEKIIYKSEHTIVSKTSGGFGIYQVSGTYLHMTYIGKNELDAIKKAASTKATHGVR